MQKPPGVNETAVLLQSQAQQCHDTEESGSRVAMKTRGQKIVFKFSKIKKNNIIKKTEEIDKPFFSPNYQFSNIENKIF